MEHKIGDDWVSAYRNTVFFWAGSQIRHLSFEISLRDPAPLISDPAPFL